MESFTGKLIPPIERGRITEDQLTQRPIDVNKMFSDMDKETGYMAAQIDIINLLLPSLSLEQIEKIKQLKYKK